MKKHAVVIAGGGPTGLTLAAELSLQDIDVAIIERRPDQELAGSRAGGLHSRTIEVLDQRGVANRFLAEGYTHPRVGFAMTTLDISDFPTRHPYLLALTQKHIERILAGWVEDLGAPIYRAREVVAYSQNETTVDVSISDGSTMRADYLVGCDGGRSIVRKATGIDFPGSEATTSWMIAEVHMSEEPVFGFRENAFGTHGIGKLEDGNAVRVVITERDTSKSGEPTLHDISQALIELYDTDFGAHSPVWLSRFTDMTRHAVTYRDRRVLLAGDAAHIHPPMGGQGLNIGVQDAVNLGWKLAQVLNNTSHENLLDTYTTERHPAAARVLRDTMAQAALRRGDDRSKAAAELAIELLTLDDSRKKIGGRLTGLDIHYDLGEGHPLLGRRMPDLDIVTANRVQRVFTLLHHARPVLLIFGESASIDIPDWSQRIRVIHAAYDGAWELPVLGAVEAPVAVLIRPDGYVAWVGDDRRTSPRDAFATWFGIPLIGP